MKKSKTCYQPFKDLGYESLRFSVFNDHRPGEWEVRIEFDSTSEHLFCLRYNGSSEL